MQSREGLKTKTQRFPREEGTHLKTDSQTLNFQAAPGQTSGSRHQQHQGCLSMGLPGKT